MIWNELFRVWVPGEWTMFAVVAIPYSLFPALLLFRLPHVGSRLGQADVSQHAEGELARHLGGIYGVVIESGYAGEDDRSGLGSHRHVSEMNVVEGRLAHA